MGLDGHRGELLKRLKSGNAFTAQNGAETMRIAELWWGFYKAWEGNDRVKAAFDEGRMTVRQIPVPKENGRRSPSVRLRITSFNMRRYVQGLRKRGIRRSLLLEFAAETNEAKLSE